MNAMRFFGGIGCVLLVCGVCAQTEWPEPKSEVERQNIATMKAWAEEVWGQGRIDLVPDLVAPMYIRHGANGTRVVTPDEYAGEIRRNLERDMRFTGDTVTADGDLVWLRWSMSVTDVPGSSRRYRGFQLYRFEEGRIAETWLLSAPAGHWGDSSN